MQSRSSNKAKRSKESILADTKNLLKILHPAIQHMPKIERIEGAPHEMKMACYNIIRHYSIAKADIEVRTEHIRAMCGEYGVLLAAFDLCIDFGLLTGTPSLLISQQLERIEEGIGKWRSFTRSPMRQERQEVRPYFDQELAVSNQ